MKFKEKIASIIIQGEFHFMAWALFFILFGLAFLERYEATKQLNLFVMIYIFFVLAVFTLLLIGMSCCYMNRKKKDSEKKEDL